MSFNYCYSSTILWLYVFFFFDDRGLSFFFNLWLEKCLYFYHFLVIYFFISLFLYFFISLSIHLFVFLFFIPFVPKKQGDNQRNFGFGQSSVLFCPNNTLHTEYNVGTYAGMLYGVTQTEFEVEIVVSPEVTSLYISLYLCISYLYISISLSLYLFISISISLYTSYFYL